ncbi:zinc finger CCHC domain-containing protein 7-like isoform X2 [Centruroides sculpturatus]|uniref:zinc finger CCHC domain-containing protein 7-like isoform X2 n=1 Tax=Centruroides sculpturatus TaxID=218467 RepID=UPI000C6E509D|nr:zinc finger CCHC domain-containing protein 7-like isoform X2 [Centruroides sculpturatus]XP_023219544.1 zinc finger CCHC domain-containing protein 7-like isoform X2 [Centruroides sculpturatus]XP_023219546.1 zinc finger CCHC domain-containing protein 7-like isoform X2 [Centruroides sculpturatus]XP_023219547.1 zinc finger CCHC domain-containing protein 7-like isoform X2 [Centruroides sculpturatus]
MVPPRFYPYRSELWRVNIEDVLHQNSKGFHSCHRCFEIGHNKRQCTEPKKTALCFLCGQFGHYEKNCLTGSCEKCFSLKHRTKNCKMVNSEKFSVPCALCNCVGHEQSDCPDFWRRFHLTTDSNKMVKRNRTVNQRVFCYNCGTDGHFGFKCDSPRMNENTFPTTPMIVDYSPLYEMEIVDNTGSEVSCFNNDSLIKLVRNYPSLFDKNHKNYEDSALKANQWSEIATELNSTVEIVKNQWVSLQDQYIKEKHALTLSNESENGETKKSNWDIYPILDEFLKM